ncbi:septum formation inhibitor Maf [Sulfurospirillum sp. T05]|uniref:Nucleoside triphosphate pyrophosphatase n=1 Tax=Sulfurospirillum tamanense TaxID=2813362 RepID=A0ABS2WT47_9BACT|nr:septum formation inhibitor Maf [Sulfurospirillum tamanensis]MBN2964842.1 septum formation inhibitor Maf [Sulfurospirillum tamanensis]
MVILASQSPTRAALLTKAGIAFRQCGVDFDEEALPYTSPRQFAYYATKGKCERFLELYGLKTPVLAADTVVTCKGKLLQKAPTPEAARAMLALQSGSEVAIMTCMMYRTSRLAYTDFSVTRYHFAPFGEEAVEAYLASDAWQGKAGAVMVEGFCKPYIRDVVGFESTAMGLCIEKLLPFLEHA